MIHPLCHRSPLESIALKRYLLINDFSVSIHRFVISMSCRVDMVTVIESGSNSEMSGARYRSEYNKMKL